MALKEDTKYRTFIALTDKTASDDLIAAVEAAKFVVPALIVATATSTTTDFGVLKVGDKVIHIPAVAGNSSFLTVATVGTLPVAAVVGDLYVVLRAV